MSMLQVCAPVSSGVGLTSYFCLSSCSIGSYVLKCCFILRMEEQEGRGGEGREGGINVWMHKCGWVYIVSEGEYKYFLMLLSSLAFSWSTLLWCIRW